MRVAQRIHQSMVGERAGQVTLGQQRVEFVKPQEPPKMTREEYAAQQRASWRSHLLGRRD